MRRPLWRLTFAIWWKLVFLLTVAGFIRGFAAYLLPWGQLAFWLVAKLGAIPVLGALLWSTPGALPALLGAGEVALSGLILFGLLLGLMRFHIGRRYGGAVLTWQAPAAAALDLFA